MHADCLHHDGEHEHFERCIAAGDGEEARDDDHVAHGIGGLLETRCRLARALAAGAFDDRRGGRRNKKVRADPNAAGRGDEQIDAVAATLPEAGRRVCEHFEQQLKRAGALDVYTLAHL